jgi:dihydrofolate reductase
MRKLIVCNIISVDGFYSGPNDDVMAMPFDVTFSEYNVERLRAADTLLLGRRSFEGFRSYWPSVADDPEAPAVEREISRLNNAIDKVVVSDSLTDAELAPWTNTRIVRRADANDAIGELKAGEGREILMFGSHVLWNDLLRAGLVDELHLMIGSAFLGDGVRVFEGPRTGLRLVDARILDGSQLLLAVYATNV